MQNPPQTKPNGFLQLQDQTVQQKQVRHRFLSQIHRFKTSIVQSRVLLCNSLFGTHKLSMAILPLSKTPFCQGSQPITDWVCWAKFVKPLAVKCALSTMFYPLYFIGQLTIITHLFENIEYGLSTHYLKTKYPFSDEHMHFFDHRCRTLDTKGKPAAAKPERRGNKIMSRIPAAPEKSAPSAKPPVKKMRSNERKRPAIAAPPT